MTSDTTSLAGTLRSALGLLSPAERMRWSLLVPFELLAATLEAGAAAMTYVLIAFVTGSGEAMPEKATSLLRTIGWSDEASSDRPLLYLVLFAAALFATKTLVRIVLLILQILMVEKDRAQVSARLFRSYLEAPFGFHLSRGSDEILHRIQFAADQVLPNVLFHASKLFATLATLATMLIVVVAANAPMAVAFGLFVAASLLVFSRISRRLLERGGRRLDDLAKMRLTTVKEALDAQKELRLLGRVQHYWQRYERLRQSTVRINFVEGLLTQLPRHLFEGVFVIGLLFLSLAVVQLRIESSQELVPLLGLYAYCGVRSLPLINSMIDSTSQLRRETIPMARLEQDFSEMKSLPKAASARDDVQKVDKLAFESLTARDLTFSFPSDSQTTLDGIDLEVHRGETVGIVGRVGAGKSTLFSVLSGLLPVQSGDLLINGLPIETVLVRWRRSLGVCWQSGTIVSGSVRENIALGLPADQIDDDAVRRAVDLAHCRQLIDQLPEGLDTKIGSGGRELSGGETRLLMLARVLYGDPEVLLFDEPTASVDSKTEASIVAALKQLSQTRTLIVVSHRPTTLVDCDRIFTLSEGKLLRLGQAEEAG